MHFFLKNSWRPFLVVALEMQAANAVKIKQIKRSDMATFFKFFLFTLLPKQSNREG